MKEGSHQLKNIQMHDLFCKQMTLLYVYGTSKRNISIFELSKLYEPRCDKTGLQGGWGGGGGGGGRSDQVWHKPGCRPTKDG